MRLDRKNLQDIRTLSKNLCCALLKAGYVCRSPELQTNNGKECTGVTLCLFLNSLQDEYYLQAPKS